jgi:long-subunit acyl-CoA synthetase (AMP-forming)
MYGCKSEYTGQVSILLISRKLITLLQTSSHTLVGRRLENIDIQDLENKLKANPFIEFAKVYTEMDGV